MRNLGVTVISLMLTTLVVGYAYYQKKQFYPSVVFITKSNPSMAVIYIQAFILVILSGKLMRKIFFGELRPVELEHLMERSWYAVTETCLAFTVFRDDFSPRFVALFTLLLFLKSFHWLADERVDFMERSPVISWLFHVRIIALLTMLGTLDVTFVSHAYQSTLNKGASVQLVFGFEYAILLTIILNIVIKYAFHVNDFPELPWENKAVFLLYTELVVGFIRVILYLSFVCIMVRIYTLPLFAFRPMYYTFKSFRKAINDVIMSRRAIRNMNTLYPDATPEELAAADNVCIICREEMHSASKKLPCNHIFHASCLRSWFQRQQTCPTCRLNILRTPGNPQTPQPQPQRQRDPPPNIQPHGDFILWPPNPPPNANADAPNPPNNPERSAQPPGPSPTVHQPPPAPENPPFFCPPFPYMAFNVPPPMPPLETMTDEELHRLELQNREGIEARVRCLRNIQCLLDAALLMMQQYCAAVAPNQNPVFPSGPSTSRAGPSGSQAGRSNSKTEKNDDTVNSDECQQSCSKTEVAPPDIPSSCSGASGKPRTALDEHVTVSSAPNVGEHSCDDEVEEGASSQSQSDNVVLRQRRLEKFSKEFNNTVA